jgi:hypothetical protein
MTIPELVMFEVNLRIIRKPYISIGKIKESNGISQENPPRPLILSRKRQYHRRVQIILDIFPPPLFISQKVKSSGRKFSSRLPRTNETGNTASGGYLKNVGRDGRIGTAGRTDP